MKDQTILTALLEIILSTGARLRGKLLGARSPNLPIKKSSSSFISHNMVCRQMFSICQKLEVRGYGTPELHLDNAPE